MASDLISVLVEDAVEERVEERVAERTAALENTFAERIAQVQAAAVERERLMREQERVAREQEHVAMVRALERMVEDTLIARFPDTPIALAAVIGEVGDPRRLQELHHSLLHAPDQAGAEQLLRAAAVPR